MKLSIIIPTYNEQGEIVECLESLGNQTYSDFEIIVVDDGSTDKTLKRAENISKTVKQTTDNDLRIWVFQQKHLGPGAARNLGAKHAKGTVLVFVDADMTFDKFFLDRLVDPILKGRAKGTFSKDEYVSNWDNVWARCWNINQGWPEKKRHPKNYPNEDIVFRAILKEEFDKVGGFTPGGYTDDYTLAEKLGYKAKSAKGAVLYHQNPDSLREVYKQAKWVGKREYKLGKLGIFVGLVRASLFFSIPVGLFKALSCLEGGFIFFKIVYDFGISVGIIEYLFGKKTK